MVSFFLKSFFADVMQILIIISFVFSYIAIMFTLIHFGVKGVIMGIVSILFFAYLKSTTGVVVSVVLTVLFCIPQVRKYLISKPILMFIKNLNVLPKISETEQVALDAGTTWVEGEFFKTKPNIKKILNEPFDGLSEEERHFLANEVEEACNLVNDWDVFQKGDLPKEAWDFLKKKKFFGMIIPKKYGGLEFTAPAQSAIVGKLGTRSQVLSITTMVPNSLGPGELLLKYGTEKQKNYYLPRLADGREIPCFGLTEPFAGSDAAAIKSHGELFKDTDGKLKIKLNFEKRYITLGGIATIIGLAFQLKDPNHLLPEGRKTGITCALLKGDLPGITRGRRHMPMHIPFINSPLWGKDVIISVEDDIIGGESGLGDGWRMLMECLSIGRGISLPAISTAASKYATKIALMYSSVRIQFGLPIGKFEAIEEILAKMISNTYANEAMRVFAASAVKHGNKPAITNAIAKYHATEISRKIVNDGMDILAGSAICVGPNNLLAHVYMGLPVGITVEGANIITRALLQFGQGLMRCHPFLYNEMMAIKNNDLDAFDKNFWGHVGSFFAKRARWFTLYFKGALFSLKSLVFRPSLIDEYSVKMERISAKFGFMADLILILYGGSFKIKEKLSGRFADVISHLFIMSAVLRKFKADEKQPDAIPIARHALEQSLEVIDKALIEIYGNLSYNPIVNKLIKILLLLPRPRREASVVSDKTTHKIVKNVLDNEIIFASLFSHIFVSKNKDDRLNMLLSAFKDMKEANAILKRIRQVKKNNDQALKDGLITKSEFDFITKWQEIVATVLEVDHFPLETDN